MFWVFLAGVGLDALFGDPRGMPHLTRLVGALSLWLEKALSALGGRTVVGGVVLWVVANGLLVAVYLFVRHWIADWSPYARAALDALLVFQCIAYKDLKGHVNAVQTALSTDIETAREQVSRIVGRDTDQMGEAEVCKAAIESGSENLNDAVIAPIFWFLVAGPLGILVFRISNTLDAMVGHRTERYERLGKFSARVDDVLNFLPARICSLLILGVERVGEWTSLKKDARKHPSVNAGWPEAAMARRLGVAIGGPMYAGGALVQTESMNGEAPDPVEADIGRCLRRMRFVYLVFVALGIGVMALWG